ETLASWTTSDGKPVRPMIVASTATVRNANQQIRGLYGRGVAMFPPQVLDVADTYFSEEVPISRDNPGRRYIGISAQGVRLSTAEIRAAEVLLLAGQLLLDRAGDAADPYMTLVGYFNALRELGGMRRLVEDDVAARLSLPLHRNMPGRVAPTPRRRAPFMEELTSRVSSRAIKDTLKAIEVPFDPAQDTTAARTAASKAVRAARGKKKTPVKKAAAAPPRIPPRDVVLATSMFGVGVDIPRLGLMTVTGQPKATSEYIQATSRVGRDPNRPGLVVTIYNWQRPRDLSHYERFGHYHDTFYQQVEALSVTPFSIPAVNRAITGAFLGALRHLHPTFNPDTGLNAVVAGDSEVERLLARFVDRASAITGRDDSASAVEAMLRKRLQHLASRRDAAQGQTLLAYRGGKEGVVTVLHDPESGIGWDMWTVPNSLRETEPE
ncbi:MAG: helicase, partial [Verrucomicrobiae bacterium]|nr:helicase [Verrucomicrobiae bacterium]